MLAFMRDKDTDRRTNLGIGGAGVAVFALSLLLARSQTTVDDAAYMRAMIPHHSIAILTSVRTHIADPSVRQLAGSIIATQRKDIAARRGPAA